MRDRIIKLSINELSASQLLYQHDKGQMVEFLEDVEDNTLVLFENYNVSESAKPQYVKDNFVAIPDELLTEVGSLIITVKLVDSNSETTQKIIKVKIMAGAEAKTDVPPENQQTFIQKIMEIINSAKEMVKSIRDDANSGKFKGEQGPPGTDGTDGYTPVKGVDYYTEAEKEEITQDIVERINLSDKVGLFILSGSAEPTTNASDYSGAKLGDICINEGYRVWICQYLYGNTIMWSELLTPVSPYLAGNFYTQNMMDNKLNEKADKADWKLVTELEVMEPIGVVEVTTDKDGNKFAYDDIYIAATNIVGAGNWALNLKTTTDSSNTNILMMLNANAVTSTPRHFFSKIERMPGVSAYEYDLSYKNASAYSNTTNKGIGFAKYDFYESTKFNWIRIYFSGTNQITSGKIKIYGRNRR